MTLGLVIPVWNDQTALNRLLAGVSRLNVFDQIVVVDDGSDVPVALPDIPLPRAKVVHTAHSCGAGAARNTGLTHIDTSHILFFDSDDMMTFELPHLWCDLKGVSFDFCIFRHADSRQIACGHYGMVDYDTTLWRAAHMGGKALHRLALPAAAKLAQTANYPWNKIWRTDFLRAHNIQYSTIPLHEDIAAHWEGFLHAHHIIASDRVAAVHYVEQGKDRLTNMHGPERLAVFPILEDILAQLRSAPSHKADLVPAFLQFVCDLLDWMRGTLASCWHADLHEKQYAFWQTAVPPELFETLLQDQPTLAFHLKLQMREGRVVC